MWGPNFAPPPPQFVLSLSLFFFFFFSFASSFVLSSTINTIHPHLHLDVSSSPHHFFSKKYFSKLLNVPSLIYLNIFLDPCVLEHFCHTPIFGETHFQIHLFFAPTCLLLPMDLLFSLFMARNMIQHLIRMMRRGFFKTPRPMLHILTWTSRWVFLRFLCLEKCCFMLHWKFDGETLSFCCMIVGI